jgi:hypothetical protein
VVLTTREAGMTFDRRIHQLVLIAAATAFRVSHGDVGV